ncbi:MAG: hypothetical protein QOJ97_862 [Solirubrobacteraceae bacterium]|jgi:hypothetical protein|nr:hypothetical protein [Solirubrobacteraceae bacterium]
MPSYLVTFAGRLNDEARGAVTRAGLLVTGGHGGGSLGAQGGQLPEIDHHTVRVADADSGQAAIEQVEAALDDHGTFSGFEGRPE